MEGLQSASSKDFPTPARAIHALYLHIPFCYHKCHYCDFYSIVDDRDRQAAFADRLIAELRLRSIQVRLKPVTIFIGGGTPTLLQVPLLQRLLEAMRELGVLEHANEFTVEANPETVTAEVAQALRAGGVDRVSLGAQSFDPALLKTLERWHDPQSVGRAVRHLREAGFGRINLDLIFAVPGQTMELLDADLDQALALEPDHVSCYSLTYEPNTAMTQRLKLGQITPMDESLERSMYEHMIDRLNRQVFEHYEVSAFARRDAANATGPSSQRCRHNLNYWTNQNWLGVGPSAASHINGYRWKNAPHLGKYLDSPADADPPVIDVEHLPEARRIGEELMLRLRLIEGVPLTWLHERLQGDRERMVKIEYLVSIHMLERTTTHLRLTRAGLCIADSVIAELL